MIKVHILVSHSRRDEIDFMEANDFRILSSYKSLSHQKRFFIVETTEEIATYLSLKYGQENVWRR